MTYVIFVKEKVLGIQMHVFIVMEQGNGIKLAQSYLKNHICQCIVLDRKFCPVCNKPCHHDTSLSPKQTIDSGHGGMSVPEIPM